MRHTKMPGCRALTSSNSLGPSGTGTVGLGDTEAFIRHDTHWVFQTRVLKHACPPSCLDMPVWTCRAQLLESAELHAELWFRTNHFRADLEASFSLWLPSLAINLFDILGMHPMANSQRIGPSILQIGNGTINGSRCEAVVVALEASLSSHYGHALCSPWLSKQICFVCFLALFYTNLRATIERKTCAHIIVADPIVITVFDGWAKLPLYSSWIVSTI